MISTEDLYEEIEKMEEVIKVETDPVKIYKAMLKSNILTIKLLHNLRTNSVAMMDFFKVPKVKSNKELPDNLTKKGSAVVK